MEETNLYSIANDTSAEDGVQTYEEVAADYNQLLDNYQRLYKMHEEAKLRAQRTDAEMSQFRQLSGQLITEYHKLQDRLELEQLHREAAEEIAAKYHKENEQWLRVSMVVPDPTLLQPMKDDGRKPSDLTNFTKIFDGIQEQLLRTKDKLHETETKHDELQDKYEALKRQLASVEKENAMLKREVASATDTVDDLKRVSLYAYDTREEMKSEVQKQKEATRKVETTLDRVRGEKDMLLRQSGILMENVASDKKLLRAVAENEDLQKKLLDFQAELTELKDENTKIKLEEEQNAGKLTHLQEQLEASEHDRQLLTEKLRKWELTGQPYYQNGSERSPTTPLAPPPPPPLHIIDIADNLRDTIRGIKKRPTIIPIDERRRAAYEEALKHIKAGVALRPTQGKSIYTEENPIVVQMQKQLHNARPQSGSELRNMMKKFPGTHDGEGSDFVRL